MNSEHARALRRAPSSAELRMWRLLHPFRTGGYHFRKQAPIGPYVADFACHHARLIIEVDGDSHYSGAGLARDARRDAALEADGYTVLHFSNTDLRESPDGVFARIAEVLTSRPPTGLRRPPSPSLPTRGRVSDRADAGRAELLLATKDLRR
ncbi:endonuclease domain-containing protein [Arsenicitalea aurantiaca]|uniref:Endonuclease domain-containing protein n=1 Tax=Arsenicitalea aurantiaca TaxID=1783274 RepID=A0A433X439_9HYPH|nr:endonuclease domain-containing protein [Arsenicitalea aurantiaca]